MCYQKDHSWLLIFLKDSVVLRNDSLLVNNLKKEDEGLYYCSAMFSGHLLDGMPYNLSLINSATGKNHNIPTQ